MTQPAVLILTPVKNAAPHLIGYFEKLATLTYPAALLSLGLLESDSDDGTFEAVQEHLQGEADRYRRVGAWQKPFGLRTPAALHRWEPGLQVVRRKVLARSRNQLLSRALRDEDWVLWLDVDVIDYPVDLIERLLATGRDIVHPHCVIAPGGRTFDHNAWCDGGRVFMESMRGGADLVRLDSVGGTVLLVRADLHRDGLVFPPFPYGRAHPGVRRPSPWGAAFEGEIETEGFAMMATDMGYQCWGMPNLEVLHANR